MSNELKLLINVENRIVGDQIVEILSHNNIEAFEQYAGDGLVSEVYMGVSSRGIDIFVNDDQYDCAKELVQAFFLK